MSLRDDVLGPSAEITAREVIDLIMELPDDSAVVASIKATLPPPAAMDSPVVTALRSRRRWRGWTTDRSLLADARDALIGKHSPRPWDDDNVSVSGRRVLDLEQLP